MYHDNLIPIPVALSTTDPGPSDAGAGYVMVRAEVHHLCIPQPLSSTRFGSTFLLFKGMILDGCGPDGGWLRYVLDTVYCHCRGAQHSVTEVCSSSRSNNVPANLPNHPSNPSSHGPRPQGSEPATSFHIQDPSPVRIVSHPSVLSKLTNTL